MKTLRVILSLAVCIPLASMCGGLYAFDANPMQGMIGGAFIGLVMGLAFGGVESVATFLYGPKEPDE